MKHENNVHPKYRKQLVKAAKFDNCHGRIKLVPSRVNRPFILQVSDAMAGARTMQALRGMGLQIVGITHRDSYTDVHVKEK